MLLMTLLFPLLASADVRSIMVTTQSEKSMEPDLLRMNVEIWSRTPTAQRTQTLAADETKRIMAILDQYKIRKEDLQTESFSFAPETTWDNSRNESRIVGFRSSQTLRITLRKTESGGKLIDALMIAEKNSAAGGGPKSEVGTNISDLRWDSTKRVETTDLAMADAVRAARKRADEIAKAAGVRVKNVYKIAYATPGAESVPRPMMMTKSAGIADSSSQTTLSGGEVKVSASVTAEFEIN